MKAKGDYQISVHLDKMNLKVVRKGGWTAWAVQLKANQRGLPGLGPPR
jgi:hypothetical protein